MPESPLSNIKFVKSVWDGNTDPMIGRLQSWLDDLYVLVLWPTGVLVVAHSDEIIPVRVEA